MVHTENVRIFCTTHETSFLVERGQQLLCGLTGHALSINFPYSEMWEFCCACETFAPIDSDAEPVAESTCRNCQCTASERFVCEECKTVTFDSTSRVKRKSYSIASTGVQPRCPGCGCTPTRKRLVKHICEDRRIQFKTALSSCPFCADELSLEAPSIAKKKELPEKDNKKECPQCGRQTVAVARFCPRCRYQYVLSSNENPANYLIGKSVESRKCRGCGSSIISDTDIYCSTCDASKGSNTRGPVSDMGADRPDSNVRSKRCPNCGSASEADKLFCFDCGTLFEEYR